MQDFINNTFAQALVAAIVGAIAGAVCTVILTRSQGRILKNQLFQLELQRRMDDIGPLIKELSDILFMAPHTGTASQGNSGSVAQKLVKGI